MKIKKWQMAVLLTAALATAFSCKKEDDEDSKSYLSGTLTFKADPYVEIGSTVTYTPSEITAPDGENVGYYWAISSLTEANDTTLTLDGAYKFDKEGSFKFTYGDTLGTFKVSCYAYSDSEKYYSSSKSVNVTVVKTGINGSIPTEILPTDNIFKDERDGFQYAYGKIGPYSWLKPNLGWGSQEEVGVGFAGSDVMSYVMGRFYNWNEALTACPDGWRLPTEEEWMESAQALSSETLVKMERWPGIAGDLIGYTKFNDTYELWEFWPEVKVTNKTGFSAISAGYCVNRKDFESLYDKAVFWTATEDPGDPSKGVYRYLAAGKPDIYVGSSDKENFYANVRCIRD